MDVTLDQVYHILTTHGDKLNKIEAHLERLNEHISEQGRDLAVLKDWRASQANGIIKQVGDLRVELAKMGAIAGGFGMVATITAAVLKALGVF